MVRDANLKMVASTDPFTTTTAKTAIDTEGGYRADVRLFVGTITDADETLNLTVEASIDGGSNYRHIGEFPIIIATDDNVELARSVIVPKPASGQTVTKVRLKARAIAGTTPSFPINAWLEPLLTEAIPALDSQQAIGTCKLMSA